MIGEMKHMVKLGTYTEVRNPESGSMTKTWVYGDAFWTKIDSTTAGSGEKDTAEKKTVTNRFIFTVHHRDDVSEDKRLIDEDGKVYDISAVLPHNERDYLTIEAQYTGKTESGQWP